MDEAAIVKWVVGAVEAAVELGLKLGARRDAILTGVDAALKLARIKNDEDLAKKHSG